MLGFKTSLRKKIFIAMIILVLLASVLIVAVTIFQYNQDAITYHNDRLERKEDQVKASINYEISKTSFEIITSNIPFIFRDKIYEIQNIQNIELSLFDLEGNLLISSQASPFKNTIGNIPKSKLEKIKQTPTKNYIHRFRENNQNFRSSYSYINDLNFKPIAILHLPYIEENEFMSRELKTFLSRLAQVYIIMLLFAIALAYFLSKYITKSLSSITDKIKEIKLGNENKKIETGSISHEIATLVDAYNDMIDELEKNAATLAANERESAWREMAKQVAHEIKNPLTPMRLSIQNFERKFDPNDVNLNEKIKEFSSSLIQQIDTMSSIASAFSNYAHMPAQKDETLNIVKISKLALEIFKENQVRFSSEEEELIVKMDRVQLIRVITNLVKNAIQAVKEVENPQIDVYVYKTENKACIKIKDNGIGIKDALKAHIFEPKFTTKSSGMGLGLAMVKTIIETYNGHIFFETKPNEGTTFTLEFAIFNP